MHFTKKNPSEKRIELKNKLKKNKILRFPGAYNPLTAKLISEIGFDGVYISGESCPMTWAFLTLVLLH